MLWAGTLLLMERLIVFTRYPEAGKAKTRLIPALEAAGAAMLHRQLAEHQLAQAQSLQTISSVSVAVQFASGTISQMQTWLGSDLLYQPQAEGSLGDRLINAFQSAFDVGYHSVVIVGTDCPDLDASLLETAFQKLQDCDLVLGPALDGGYYLIGLRRAIPELFQGIAWSTATVLQQTLAIATRLNLAVATLPTLSDIDTPADLQILRERLDRNRWAIDPDLPLNLQTK